jgi:hypothetical protein
MTAHYRTVAFLGHLACLGLALYLFFEYPQVIQVINHLRGIR